MVHNGIEYGDMQLIAEVYDVMKNVLMMENEEIANLFDEWNNGELSSYLIEITANILRRKEDGGDGYVVDGILDKTGMKGTGKWTIQEGAEKGVAVPTMAAALDARMLSARKEERVEAENVLKAPAEVSAADKAQVIEDLRAGLYCSKICSYAQGLCLIKAASDEYDWNVDLAECARLRIRYQDFPGASDIRTDLDKALQNWGMTEEELFSRTRQIHQSPEVYRNVRARREDWS